MAVFDNLTVSPEAIREAMGLGIRVNTTERLLRMVKRSAPITHREGNRRFDNYLFRVDDGQVLSIKRYDPTTKKVVG